MIQNQAMGTHTTDAWSSIARLAFFGYWFCLGTLPAPLSHAETVRERLVATAAATRKLVQETSQHVDARFFGAAEPEDKESRDDKPFGPDRGKLAGPGSPFLGFPLLGNEVAYLNSRPWERAWLRRWYDGVLPYAPAHPWPTTNEARELRILLSDADPAVRCLAIGALASLGDPDDLARIAVRLKDRAEALPALAPIGNRSSGFVDLEPVKSNGLAHLNLRCAWFARTVNGYAKVALRYHTGETFDSRTFPLWWQTNWDGRQRVWYWRERLHRDLQEAWQSSRYRAAGALEALAWPARRAQILKSVADELHRLPAEVEAKIRLCALNQQTSALVSINEQDVALMGEYDCQRLSAERLLDLLDRKDLWLDLDFRPGARESYYDALVAGLGAVTIRYFHPEHVPRLKAVLEREAGNLSWRGRSSLIIGISRLLPLAREGQFDSGGTLDGLLRSALRRDSDATLRGILATELMQKSLANNLEFFHELYFDTPPEWEMLWLRLAILENLGAPPRDALKRKLLAGILLDPRFDPMWDEWNLEHNDDIARERAIRALRAHAGKELLPDWELRKKYIPVKIPGLLKEIRQVIETNLAPGESDSKTP